MKAIKRSLDKRIHNLFISARVNNNIWEYMDYILLPCNRIHIQMEGIVTQLHRELDESS